MVTILEPWSYPDIKERKKKNENQNKEIQKLLICYNFDK